MHKLIILLILPALYYIVTASDAIMTDTTEMQEKPKVLVTHSEVPEAGFKILRQKCEVIVAGGLPSPSRLEILKLVKGVDAICWVSHDRLNAEILDAAGPQLKTISTMTAGLDNVDCAGILARNITLGHTPIILNDAVADQAIGLMIAAGRRLHEGRRKIENNEWEYRPQWLLGQDIKGSTVGIVGLGGIGQAIAKRLKGFDVAKIVYSGHKEKPEAKELNAEFVTFDELIAKSNFVFISAPLTNETRGLFNIGVFKKMKNNSVLINVGRGSIINTNDLVTALSTGLIFSAGLDVMDPEPIPRNHKILSLDNCVLAPHLGSATLRTRSDMSVIAAHNILRGLAGEAMFSPVLKC